jgi:crotonobetainyl-CoA:carnitine CoA-transferase CaiB-like acyl-CoA transferase
VTIDADKTAIADFSASLGAPSLLSLPENGLTTIYSPTLDWNDLTPAPDHYEIQIATDNAFNNLVIADSATVSTYITIAPLTDKHWKAILEAVGHPEWFEGDAPRADRVRHSIKSLIDAFPTQPSAYWLERIEAADVPCGPVNDFDSIWTDPQFEANETFFEYEHPKAGPVRGVRHPARLSGRKQDLQRHAPGLGENTDEILRDFGFSATEISKLHQDAIVR